MQVSIVNRYILVDIDDILEFEGIVQLVLPQFEESKDAAHDELVYVLIFKQRYVLTEDCFDGFEDLFDYVVIKFKMVSHLIDGEGCLNYQLSEHSISEPLANGLFLSICQPPHYLKVALVSP